MATKWWVVMVEGETPDLFGPYRSEDAAQRAADAWNSKAGPDDRATVEPVRSGPIR